MAGQARLLIMPEVLRFFSLLQRILDPEAGKSREVAIVGAKRRAMFDC
jgi:hypothetical protein